MALSSCACIYLYNEFSSSLYNVKKLISFDSFMRVIEHSQWAQILYLTNRCNKHIQPIKGVEKISFIVNYCLARVTKIRTIYIV